MGTLLNRRRYMGGGGSPAPQYLMTKDTNPEVLAVCYAQHWCASPDYMTYEEAALVTDLGAAFRFNTQITHFEEIEYFGVTTIGNYCFQSATKLSVLGNMPYLTSAGQGCFRQMSALTSIGTYPNLMTIPSEFFYNTNNVQSITLLQSAPPTINGYAFPGNSCPIYVPDELYDTYQALNTFYWNQVKSRITKLSEKP